MNDKRNGTAMAAALAFLLAAGAAFWTPGYSRAEDKPPAPPPAANAPAPGAPDLANLPEVIFDDSVGDWVVDRFAGNSTTGSRFYQGPAREVGGLGRVGTAVETSDGTVFMTRGGVETGAAVRDLVKVTRDGMLRLVMGRDGLLEGPMEECQAGLPIWNPKEKALYVTGPNCLRRVVEKPDGSRRVEVAAGVPNKEGKQDGPAKEATFQTRYRGIVCNSRGTFFWLEEQGLRRIESGTVSSVSLTFMEERKSFNFIMGSGFLSLGENDDTLYISDFYGQGHQRVLKCDLKTGELTRVAGVNGLNDPYHRHGHESDGPALTHVSGNSGMTGRYDPFHNALWVSGPDHMRFRWLRLDGDGWVRTVFGAARPGTTPQPREVTRPLRRGQTYDDNGLGIPGEQFRAGWNGMCGFDSKGGVFVSHLTNETGVWRAYNKKEAKP